MTFAIPVILAISGGGAMGALARYTMHVGMSSFWPTAFPLGTLSVNVMGSFLMGVLATAFVHVWTPPETLKLFFLTGFLGAFTTFSAFSLDTMMLWGRGDILGTVGYILGSVVLSILAMYLGSGLIGKWAG